MKLEVAAYQIIQFSPVTLVIIHLAMQKARLNKSFSRIIVGQERGSGILRSADILGSF